MELTDLTVDELREKCREAGLTGYSDLRKDELIELLQEADEPDEETHTRRSWW